MLENAETSKADKKQQSINNREDTASFFQLNRHIMNTRSTKLVREHIINMVLASNRQFGQLKDVDGTQLKEVRQYVNLMRYGMGPRAAQMLMKGTIAWSLMFEENPNDEVKIR